MRGLKLNRGYTFQNNNDNHQMLVFNFLHLLNGTHKSINVEIGWSQLRYETVAKKIKFRLYKKGHGQASGVIGFTTDDLLI